MSAYKIKYFMDKHLLEIKDLNKYTIKRQRIQIF